MDWCSSAASARAEARSWPNGFSTTTRPVRRQPSAGETGDDAAEEEGRDLEVEDRGLRVADRLPDPTIRRVLPEVALDVRKALRETLEHTLVELLAGTYDRVAGALHELVDRPVVDRHADDRAVEQATLLEAVERPERHHLGEVAGDAEDDEHVCLARVVGHGARLTRPAPRALTHIG